jgi:pimeloyl-ACP methyl ester carboxylesterase
MLRKVIAMPPERITEPRENLARITMPTLVLWAEKDRVLPVHIARQLYSDLPDAELEVVPDCGHFLQEERPDEVVRHLLRFLGQPECEVEGGSERVA